MSNTTELVHELLDQDLVLREAIARDVTKDRAVAVWLKKHRGIDADIGAIERAVRRYEPPSREEDPLGEWDTIQNGVLNDYGPVVVFELKNKARVAQRLPSLYEQADVDANGLLQVIPSRKKISILAEPAYEENVYEIFEGPDIDRAVHDIYFYGIELTGRIAAPGLAGAAISPALTAASVQVVFLASTFSEFFVGVHQDDQHLTLSLLDGLLNLPGHGVLED